MRLEIELKLGCAAASFVSPSAVYVPKAPDVVGESVVLKRKSPIIPVMFGFKQNTIAIKAKNISIYLI